MLGYLDMCFCVGVDEKMKWNIEKKKKEVAKERFLVNKKFNQSRSRCPTLLSRPGRTSDHADLLVHGRSGVDDLLSLELGAACSGLSLLPEPDSGEENGEEGDDASDDSEDVSGKLSTKAENVNVEVGDGMDTAGFHPLPVGSDGGVLSAVDELGQGDVSVAEDVNIAEGPGSVLELDAEEVTDVGGRTTAQLNGNGGSVVGNAEEFGVLAEGTSLVEERDEWLVGSLDEHELEGVAIEGDTFQRAQDGVQDGATSDVANAIDIRGRENTRLVIVSPVTRLLEE